MNRRISTVAAALFVIAAAHTQAVEPIGYYASASAQGPTWREMCITKLSPRTMRVVVSTTYCPSEACMNSRMDTVEFNAPARGQVFAHVSGSCRLQVRVRNGRAVVSQVGGPSGDAGALVAAGDYERRVQVVLEGACSPQGIQPE